MKTLTIEKSFPADTKAPIYEIDSNNKKVLINPTFLNDPKVNGELYAYLQSISIGENKETRVYKDIIPSQAKLGILLAPTAKKPLTRQTISAHMKYLIDNEYLIDHKTYYTINKKEKIFFRIPLNTLTFLLNTVKEGVIKTYIYLGQRNNYKPNQYTFTVKEICEHLGLNYKNNSSMVSSWLIALEKFELIKLETFYDNGKPIYRLANFNLNCPTGTVC